MRLLCLAASALLLTGCGYIGEPMYPLLNIPMRVTDLAVVQRGGELVYQFNLPNLTTEGKITKIGQVELRAGEAGPQPFNLGDWEKRSTRLDSATPEGKHVVGDIAAANDHHIVNITGDGEALRNARQRLHPLLELAHRLLRGAV